MIHRLSVRRRAPRTLAASLFATALASSGASALPESLDRVPTDALAVVVAPSVERLDKNVGSLLAAIEMPAVTSPAQLLSVVGLSRGINMARPVALVLMPGDLAGEVPPALLLLPVSDYAAIAQSLGADAGGAIAQGNAAGETIFIKRIPGDYAAVSPLRSILERYSGDAGLLNAHRAALGPTGVGVVEQADAALIANVPALAPILAPAIDNARNQLRALTAMNPAMGPGANLDNSPIELALRNFLRDGQTGVLALRASGMGLTATLSATFKPNSELAGIFAAGGNSTELLAKLPDQPFMLAYAVDASAPTARTILANAEALAAQNPLAAEQVKVPGIQSLRDSLTGQAGMILPNPAGLMGGVLARGVYYFASPNADAVISSYRSTIEELNGKSVAGLNYTGAFNQDSTTVAGRKVSAYSIRVQSAPGSLMASPMATIYGPSGGPSGFIGKTPGGAVVTTQPDQRLMDTAVNAAEGKGNPLAANRVLRQVQSNLGPNRVFEGYFSIKPVLDQVTPFLAMMGQPLDPNSVPAELPPIGLSVSSADAAMRADIFLPAPVIKTGAALAEIVQGFIPAGAGPQNQGNNRNAPPF